MNVPGQNHRDPWFAAFFKGVLADSKYVFQTQKGTPFIFTGATTGCSLTHLVQLVWFFCLC
jgi:alanine-glyoxylate transaminase/serine-glyoxylate transaminase/serine-pyruvate transaminase